MLPSDSQNAMDAWETDGGPGTTAPAPERFQNISVKPTKDPKLTKAQQIANAASALRVRDAAPIAP